MALAAVWTLCLPSLSPLQGTNALGSRVALAAYAAEVLPQAMLLYMPEGMALEAPEGFGDEPPYGESSPKSKVEGLREGASESGLYLQGGLYASVSKTLCAPPCKGNTGMLQERSQRELKWVMFYHYPHPGLNLLHVAPTCAPLACYLR